MAEANALLDAAKKASLPPDLQPGSPQAAEREAAVTECSSLDETWLVKYQPIARRASKVATTWIFGDLLPQVGQAESLEILDTLLTRLDAIEAGKARQGVDAKVLTALSASGLTKAERVRVAKLIVAARGAGTLVSPAPVPTPTVPDAAFKSTLEDLHLWWKAASGIARTAGLKKVELIRLGLATPSKKKKEKKEDPPT